MAGALRGEVVDCTTAPAAGMACRLSVAHHALRLASCVAVMAAPGAVASDFQQAGGIVPRR
jgi:hypothetical protein